VGKPISPRKIHRYSVEFKLTAVRLTRMAGVQVQTVADTEGILPGGSWGDKDFANPQASGPSGGR
jgi:hypothetical protein